MSDIETLVKQNPGKQIVVNADGSLLVRDTLPTKAEVDASDLKEYTDTLSATTYAKLAALRTMSPDQVKTWVTSNVTNVTQIQDAVTTLAIAVSILSRRL